MKKKFLFRGVIAASIIALFIAVFFMPKQAKSQHYCIINCEDERCCCTVNDYPVICPICRVPLMLWIDDSGKPYLKCEVCGWTLEI